MNKVPYASVRPTSSLNLLSHREVEGVMNYDDEVFKLFRQCALAVLNTGMQEDDADAVFNYFHDFDIRIIPQSRGIKLDVVNAPANAFVNGKMIKGIREHLFSALRDIVYTHHKIFTGGSYSSANSDDITDTVFRILRNAGILKANTIPRLVVCWGGHAIKRHEYEYSKQVGYELGIRGLNIATGCGTGAMRGPMKGAAVGHAKQQIRDGRYIGITEPGIIASESPNPTVSELVILPDIEKRLEAFVRLSHSIIVFPGGAGTVEEILYLLSLLMHPDNRSIDIPVIFAAPIKSKEYFSTLDNFICNTLGKEAREFYQIVIGEPERVAQKILEGVDQVQRHRRRQQESYSFNWQLKIPMELQTPFHPSHENMRQLKLHYQQPKHALAAQMRCGFSGIVAGNIKAEGVEAVRKHGPYILQGDSFIIKEFDVLLKDFIANGRMKLKDDYKPCYRLDE
ncbi:MAG: putative Rossmann-fold nucleotide-binding protein [Oceanicoccus sp.]|jgi:predicted Rossmann-fold nucleotide-binding protein